MFVGLLYIWDTFATTFTTYHTQTHKYKTLLNTENQGRSFPKAMFFQQLASKESVSSKTSSQGKFHLLAMFTL